MSEEKKERFGGYPPYRFRFSSDRVGFKLDDVTSPQTLPQAIDMIVFAALPDIDAYKGSTAYQNELILCAAAWLIGRAPLGHTPESALQEFLDYDRYRAHEG